MMEYTLIGYVGNLAVKADLHRARLYVIDISTLQMI